LIDTWTHSARQWGDEQADRYVAAIEAAAVLLSENPNIGTIQRYNGRDYRRWRVGEHAFIFRRIGNELRVIRILHVSMDGKRHIN
jgi:toxin ParE1/3/4